MDLYSEIVRLHNEGSISMHVPGHKNNTIGNLSAIRLSYDMTEIPPLDNLHEPMDVLLRLNRKLSDKHQDYEAFAMVNGSTNGILASIYTMYKNGKTRAIIIGDAHKSLYNALQLFGMSHTNELGTPLDTDFMFYTTPSYMGYMKRIEGKHNIPIIVDEAHGAHLGITQNFKHSALDANPDIVIQSYHKMLPALTGAAVIFCRVNHYINEVREGIRLFETSSPSYLTLLSIESAHSFYNTFEDERFFQNKALIIEALIDKQITVIEPDDPAKLILTHPTCTAYELDACLQDQYIFSEMASDDGVLWCLPLFHEGDTYPLARLIKRIQDLQIMPITFQRSMTDWSILLNKKCITTVVPYPPGIPLIHEGEAFNAEHLKTLEHFKNNHVKIEGITINIEYYSCKEE